MSVLRDAAAFWENPTAMQAHWRGFRKYMDHGATVRSMVNRIGDPDTILEWGSGGGAIASWFPNVSAYYGVDISQASLDQAAKMTGPNFHPVLMDIDAVESVDVPPVDLVICVAVIQHMPSVEYAERAVRAMLSHAKPDGRALIQTRSTRFDHDGEAYEDSWRSRVLFEPGAFITFCESLGWRALWSQPATPDYSYHALERV